MTKISKEFIRFFLGLLIVIVVGLVSGYWLIPLFLFLALYISWNFYKLYQLESWMLDGFIEDKLPDSNGIWAGLAHNTLKLKHQADRNKTRQKTLLKRFNNVISSLPDATLVLDAKNEIKWMNHDAARLLKLQRKKDLGHRLDNLFRIPQLHKALGKTSSNKIKIASPSDDNITLMVHVSALKKDTRIIIVRDISQRQQLEESRKYFVANASHELRTPLSVISGYLEILRLKKHQDPEIKNMLDNSYQQAQRMNQLISDLLILSKLENRELSRRKVKPVKLGLIIKDICSHLNKIMGERHVITLDLDLKLSVSGHKKELYSLVENLLSNSLKHTPAGTMVKVSWQLVNKLAVLTVEDNGPGIAEENIAHVTERFFQEYKVEAVQGSGLGLSLVKHIVQRHGARLDISSIPDVSTRFSVTFPD